ncbi:AAA family ATPase [Polaribacter marinivivus]|uniref:AAA family ATPase n=1 Tax=Polaribacter marinivivus TaxID=1524260 RepID=A0ABV8R555_9FLAO
MELLSLYINNHFLFKKPEFFNFGGKYTFYYNKEGNILNIYKKDNLKYIQNFYGTKLSNISAIVGNNGVGKTSIMKVLNRDTKCEIISIFLDGDNIIIHNQADVDFKTDFKFEIISPSQELYPLYYSTHIDYNLKDISSVISQSNLILDSLEDYYYDTILKQVFFLNQKGQFLQTNYNNFPFYENLVIKVNQVDKSIFLNSEFYKNATIGKSITKQLEMLWNHYAIPNEPSIHGNFNFLNNFEVFILSLLVTDDTFAQTNSNGYSFGFQDVLDEEDFERKLIVFLKKRLDNIDRALYQSLENNVEITFNNTEELIKKINSYPISKIAGGFEFNPIKTHAIQTINRYSAIWELYHFIYKNTKAFIFEKPNEIKLSVKQDSSENFLETFIKLYQNVHESIQYIQFEFRIFNIFPEKRLSTGEQSLLNFYSSIYAFVRKGEQHIRKHNQYLLLLDEPETGYHAIWKKKFIKSITEILPELFKELKQDPNIQVIFTTHDALTLSDIRNDNITYLKKLGDSSIKVFKNDDVEKPEKSFGANITDLLADSFFVDDGLMGDFAKEKIQEVLNNLNYIILSHEVKKFESDLEKNNKDLLNSKKEQIKNIEGEFLKRDKNYLKNIIDIVDEPILRYKMDEMYSQAFPEEIDKDETLRRVKRILGNAGLNLEDLNQ